MYKKSLKFMSIIALLALTACGGSVGFTQNKNKFMERQVSQEKLSNGSFLMVGFKQPATEASCSKVYEESKSWELTQIKGNLNLGGGYGVLKDNAIEYVNANPNSGINYAYVDIPNEINVAGIPVKGHVARIHYCSCKNPPAKHSNPFSD